MAARWASAGGIHGVTGLGLVLALVALLADPLGLSSQPGFGSVQIAGFIAGLLLVAWGLTRGRPRLAGIRNRLLLSLGSLYFTLWIVELLLTYPLNPRADFKMPIVGLEGLYEIGEQTGYRMTPNYEGLFDDGIVRAPVQTNSRGDRDAEPRLDHPMSKRVLLLGDSQTWGHGLAAADTIQARIEHHAKTGLDAYCLGVPGYGAGDSLARYTEVDWWQGPTVVYIFFANDLQNDNVNPGGFTVYKGFPVPVYRPDGERYTEQEWDRVMAITREHGHVSGEQNPVRLTFTLVRLRKMLSRAFDRNARLIGYSDEHFGPDNVKTVLGHTAQMRALAQERGAAFKVVVLPAVGEAAANEYSDWTREYVEGLVEGGYDHLELVEPLEREHYFGHDPHINAAGADLVAHAIAAYLEGDSA